MNTNYEITKCEEDTNKVMNEVKNLRLSDSSDDKNVKTRAHNEGSTSAMSGARPKVRQQFGAVRKTYLSKLHLDMLMDEDLQRVVTKYEEIRNRRVREDNRTVSEQPATSQWFPKDSEWVQKMPTTSAALKRSDYLQDLVKNNQPGPIAVPSKENRVTREAKAKAEQLKKQIQENIKVINEKFKDLNLATPKPQPVRRRSESQSSSSTSSKKKKNSREKPVKVKEQLQPQKPLTINNAPLSKEENLMLSLLSLQCPLEREQYLIKVAKERGILQRNPLNNVLALNSKYGGIFPIIKERAKQNIEQMAPCMLQINGVQKKVDRKVERKARNSLSNTPTTSGERKGMVNGQASEENKKKKFKADSIKKELSYQDQVMQIVNAVEELPKDPFALKYYFNMPKNPLNTAVSQEHIDKFVSRLVSEGAGHVHKGDIRINSKNYGQAFVCDKETRDVFIGTPCLRRYALQGDIVEIYVHHGVEVEVPVTEALNDSSANEENGLLVEGAVVASKPRKLGFVTRIVEKNKNRTCIGTFSEKFSKETKSARFVPRDAKMPIIHVPKQNWPNALLLEDPKEVEKVVYLAEIIDWKGEKAIGNILKPIGKCGELEVENEAILVQNHLDITPFSEEIINQLPKSPFIIPPEEFQKRTDLRRTTIFTIDPLTARDLDDALSCRRLDNGNYEIGVHISDVTYFLKEGSDLDNLVKEKATTIYMVDNVYHMLPKPLCFLCSLLPGEDKLAFSVFWEMREDATIVSTRFARTIINSCTQFAYEHAQKIIDLPEGATLDTKDFPEIMNGVTLTEIQDIIKVLRKLALKLREKRMNNGALKIDQPKLSFRLDPETGKPVRYGVYELKEANRMIEDWMLLANCTVAAYIFKYAQNQSILRNHAPPSDNSMDNLEGTLKRYNYILNGRSSTELRDTMEQIISSSGSPAGARTVMNVLLSKPMQRAKYFCSGTATQIGDFHHFALAVKIYTHFTSPIRRYADVMVHRTLAGVLDYSPPSNRTTEELQSLANICNMQKFNAKNAGDESSDLYFRTYLSSVGSIKTRAAVIALGVYSCEVVLMETGQSVKIFYKSLEPNTFVKVYDGEKITKVLMFWPKEVERVQQRIITIFSELGVELTTQKMKLAINRVFPQ